MKTPRWIPTCALNGRWSATKTTREGSRDFHWDDGHRTPNGTFVHNYVDTLAQCEARCAALNALDARAAPLPRSLEEAFADDR